jgi:heptosyltransferase-1
MSKQEKRCLIVKTSSYGDILHSLPSLQYLKERHSVFKVDWVVEQRCANLLRDVIGIDELIICDFKKIRKRPWLLYLLFLKLRQKKYDIVFDLQGNCKSGVVTLFTRASCKVGFSRSSVREWPNLLTTNKYINIDRGDNVRMQYLNMLKSYFKDEAQFTIRPIRLGGADVIKVKRDGFRIMICPFSKWLQKMVPMRVLVELIRRIEKRYEPEEMIFVFGSKAEEEYLHMAFPKPSMCMKFVGNMSFALWQKEMERVDVVLTVDSCSLALSGVSDVMSFAIFGPTKKEVFMPLGKNHFAYQAKCPYGREYVQSCPLWRKCCPSCIEKIDVDEVYQAFCDFICRVINSRF